MHFQPPVHNHPRQCREPTSPSSLLRLSLHWLRLQRWHGHGVWCVDTCASPVGLPPLKSLHRSFLKAPHSPAGPNDTRDVLRIDLKSSPSESSKKAHVGGIRKSPKVLKFFRSKNEFKDVISCDWRKVSGEPNSWMKCCLYVNVLLTLGIPKELGFLSFPCIL